MNRIFWLFIFCLNFAQAQQFTRSELPTSLSVPWEITYGPDNYLWVSEKGGTVARIDPQNGSKTIIYTAPDYFGGSLLEQSPLCFNPTIGAGTLGLTLHPDFLNPDSSFIYFVYSYNQGTVSAPSTNFKIKRLTWNSPTNTVTNSVDLVDSISTGYDHLGGRLLAVKQNGVSYLFLTIGDHGTSEDSSPTCYVPQSTNPNNFAQDPTTENGKIHRFNMDGSIPIDNPIPGNSFYTRGHRNPQGLMYNPSLDILYDSEHGDRTDDEINVLHAGMNYGWKNVRGFHSDNNYPGEASYIASYVPDINIPNDSLVQPFYSFCATPPDVSNNYLDWCTVAPSDGIYYGSNSIPEWTNSLLITTLKNGVSTDCEVYQFKLDANGSLTPSTFSNPNPKRFFGEDQALNGRLRDIAISPNGKKIYLINNFGSATDKITVYEYLEIDSTHGEQLWLYPNPSSEIVTIKFADNLDVEEIQVINTQGQIVYSSEFNFATINTSSFSSGIYFIELKTPKTKIIRKYLKE
jgi:glucose/arabinose dehydrogenase